MTRHRLFNRIQQLTGQVPGVPEVKRRLQHNTTACGLTYWMLTLRGGLGFKLICYHRVLERPDPFYGHGVLVDQFAQQIELFRRFCAVLSLDEVLDRLDRGQSLPKRCVVLTFDDGYRDTATVAWPLLQRYGLPATLYVAVGGVQHGALWPDLLREAVRRSPHEAATLECFPDGPHRLSLATVSDRLLVIKRLQTRLKRLPASDKDRALRMIVRQIAGRPIDELPIDGLMCTWDDLKRLAAGGMTIGAHTLTHPVLGRVSTADASTEIAASRRLLQKTLRVPVDHFAYPFGARGDVTPQVRAIVQAAGFRSACTTVTGVNQSTQDRLMLKRVDGTHVSTRQLVRAMTEELS
jgi:peptidoglycan/xylan/chitin deacetylase (PgdA/CDA1 family)